MKTLAVANHKGGVGKTATARALGDALAGAGLRVLLVDTDHQGSLTLSCGVREPAKSLANVYAVAGHPPATLAEVAQPVAKNLDLAPASLALAAADAEIVARPGREFILADALEAVATRYDVAIVDCPPALGQLVINALVAADAVLIPAQPQPVDVAGVRLFLETVARIRANRRLNPGLSVLGILLTFWDKRLNTHKAAWKAMQANGWPVLPMRVPRTVRVAEAAAVGQSVLTYDPQNPAADAYRELAKVVLKWLRENGTR